MLGKLANSPGILFLNQMPNEYVDLDSFTPYLLSSELVPTFALASQVYLA